MTLTIGRCTLVSEPSAVAVNGSRVDFLVHVNPTTAGDANHWAALKQQFNGLVGNDDEPVVPVTWSTDSTFDGVYRVLDVSLPSWNAMYVRKETPFCTISLQRVLGYSNALCEMTTQSVVRTNAHSFTVPPSVIATQTGGVGVDLRPTITPAATLTRACEFPPGSSIGISAYTQAAPVALTTYRDDTAPANFYRGACMVEVPYGGTFRTVVGRNIAAATQWRISNGLVRLGYIPSLVAFGIEIWGGTLWEPIGISHITNGSVTPVIGLGGYLSILRNSPECVVVRVGIDPDFTYRIMRGNNLVEASWTSRTATKYGVGFTATVATTAVSTWGVRATSNDTNGNRCVFGMPVAITADNTNGRINAAVAATSGSMFMGVELNGSSAVSGDAAADLANQYFGLTNWSQKVIPR